MGKYVVAKGISITLENYKHGTPHIYIYTPVEYTFYDFLEIVKMYTGYSDKYDWNIFLPYYDDINILIHYKKDSLDEIKLIEYFEGLPDTKWLYGKILLDVGWRYIKKYTKAYPSVLFAQGKFPTEEEFIKNKKIKDIDRLYGKDDWKDFDERLKEHFRKRYKISNELVGKDYNGYEDSNKIIKI
jgi:hypothetical protein